MRKDRSKRLRILDHLLPIYRKFADGIILSGSMAYGTDATVTADSDIDLLLFVKSLADGLSEFLSEEHIHRICLKRYFEAVCHSFEYEGVKISVHILPIQTAKLISLTFVGDLRVFRHGEKDGSYLLHAFDGRAYDYCIKNIPVKDCSGFRTIVPISFINRDRYFFGIYRDKFLSFPQIKHDRCGLDNILEENWRRSVEIYKAEDARLKEKLRFENALYSYRKFSAAAKKHVAVNLSSHM